MAKKFTPSEWTKIRKELNRSPASYGLPNRVYGSVLIGSFNIRKLGKLGGTGRDPETMKFLADTCRHFDLLAIQEVMTEMAGIRKLKELMGSEYGLIVSDVVGTFPGERGNEERLAYIYNRSIVRRSELVTEVTTSRTKVLKTLARYHQALYDLMHSNKTAKDLREFFEISLPMFEAEVKAGKNPKLPKEPKFKVPVKQFLQFIRNPFAVGFKIQGHPGLEPYELLAVNAHLHFGQLSDRRNEAAALIEWILGKVHSSESPNVMLLGDLNFDFDKPKTDLKRILARFDDLRDRKKDPAYISFPFIFPNPNPSQKHAKNKVFRSNIRQTQTYDQIGIFSKDKRVGKHLQTTPTGHQDKTKWGKNGMADYGVFDFASLFCKALHGGKSLDQLTHNKRHVFYQRFEHKVSDHMPIWLRLPLPTANKGFPTET